MVEYVAIELLVDSPFTPTLNYDPDRNGFYGIISRRHFSATEHLHNLGGGENRLKWTSAAANAGTDALRLHVENELAGTAFGSAAQFAFEVSGRAMNVAIASTRALEELAEFAAYRAVTIDQALHEFADSIEGSVEPSSPVRLTPREIDVLTLTANGRTRDEIAVLLKIGPATVKDHLQRASLKLGGSNKTHAVALAIQQGLIRP